MQALIELLAGFFALLITAVLGQFGVDLNTADRSPPEVHRVNDCHDASAATLEAGKDSKNC